jgi:PPOX class probable F420-dependent enzyme
LIVVELVAADVRLLRGRNFGHVATIGADGAPQVSPMWLDARDGFVVLNTASGRVKDRNVQRDPRVAVSVHDQSDPYRWLAIRGTVVERTTDGAAEHIDELNRRYHDGEAWQPRAGEQRVLYRIRPERIARSTS